MKLSLGKIAKKLKNRAVADTNLLKQGLSSLKKEIDTGLAVDRLARKNLGSNISAGIGNTANNIKTNVSSTYELSGAKNAVEDAKDALISIREGSKKVAKKLPTPMVSVPNSLVEKAAQDLATTRKTLGRLAETERAVSGAVGKTINTGLLKGIQAIKQAEASAVASAPRNREFLQQGYKIIQSKGEEFSKTKDRLKTAALKAMQKKGANTDAYSQVKRMFDDINY